MDRVYRNQGNRAVLKEIQGKNLEILDVGCGAGDNASILIRDNHAVDGITHSEEEAMICLEIMRHVYLHDLANGLPENLIEKYDYIICSHVLEHIAYPDKLLQDLKSALKDGGKLLVALPNVMHYRSRIKLILGEFEYEETGIWDATHLRWYTYKSGKKLLERNGYYVYKSWVDGEIPMLRFFKIIPVSLRKRIFALLTGVSKGFFSGQLLYKARLPISGTSNAFPVS